MQQFRFAPGVTAIVLLFYIAAWSLTTGILEIVGAIRLRKEIKGEVWWILSGIVSILFALLLMIFPGTGILVWLLGVYAIVFGVLLIAIVHMSTKSQCPDLLSKAPFVGFSFVAAKAATRLLSWTPSSTHAHGAEIEKRRV